MAGRSKGRQRCDGCGADAATVMTTAANRRLCQTCADAMFSKVAALLATPEAPAVELVSDAVAAPSFAAKMRAARRRRSARG